MRSLSASIIIASLMVGGAALAKDGPQKASPLNDALAEVAASASAQGPKPPEHFKPKKTNGQGVFHANAQAILKVCGKNTPAAQRAAICQTGISPN